MRKLEETQMQTTERRARMPMVYRVTPILGGMLLYVCVSVCRCYGKGISPESEFPVCVEREERVRRENICSSG